MAVSTIALIVAVIAGANALWVLFWFLLNWSSGLGAKLSKKVGTANEKTDGYIEQGKNFSKELLQKLVWRKPLPLWLYLSIILRNSLNDQLSFGIFFTYNTGKLIFTITPLPGSALATVKAALVFNLLLSR